MAWFDALESRADQHDIDHDRHDGDDPHRYDASRCPHQAKEKKMKIPLTSHAAIVTRITALESRLTALELRMHVYDRHDGDDAHDGTPEEEK